MEPVIHEVGEFHGSGGDPSGMSDWIQPNCTCGWKGRKIEAYNNWQWSLVHQAKIDHLEGVRRERQKQA